MPSLDAGTRTFGGGSLADASALSGAGFSGLLVWVPAWVLAVARIIVLVGGGLRLKPLFPLLVDFAFLLVAGFVFPLSFQLGTWCVRDAAYPGRLEKIADGALRYLWLS